MINIVNGGQKNIVAVESLKNRITQIMNQYTGTAYFGFALSELDNERIIIDALIVTREKGILAINFSSGDDETDREQMDRIYILLRGLLEKNAGLRNRRELAIPISYVTYCVDHRTEDSEFVNEDSFLEFYNGIEKFDESYFEALNEALDKIVSAKPRKLRKGIKKENSLGAKIKKIEKQIANMDEWQRTAAYEMPDRPQRIRGLAGSGKTVVLALKAAYLHFLDPTADIAVTFYSRTLYEQFKKLISEFYQQYSGEQVDFDKVHLLHAWGAAFEPGMYSVVAKEINETVYTYNEAIIKYGREKAFEGICNDLLKKMELHSIDNLKIFDHILIDEAQDLPPAFFRIAYRLFKDPNKRRLVFAYDELQNLSQRNMPSLGEMFGVDENGEDLVEVGNEAEGEPKTDILLPVCYRNTKWALSIAHALGFGIYRDVKQPLVQFFEDLQVWEQIGYEVAEGHLDYNSNVKLIRSAKSTPKFFEELLEPEEAVVVHPKFADKEEEYTWIAKQIKKNVTEDELDPDDILVIFPNALEAKRHYSQFSKILVKAGVESIMPGVDVDKDTFSQKGCITCTHIYRAKGNEKPMVYLADAEYGCLKSEIIQARNTLFTAITRSRAWVRITGVGSGMDLVETEINKCRKNEYVLEINIPSKPEIEHLNLLNRGKKEQQQVKNVEKTADQLIKMLKSGEIEMEDIPQLNDLAELLKQRKGE